MPYNIHITPNPNSFFKEDFFWNNIPDFAVITGVNGSGKTKLLDAIDIKTRNQSKRAKQLGNVTITSEEQNKKIETTFYIKYNQSHILLNYDINKNKQQIDEIIQQIKSFKLHNSLPPNERAKKIIEEIKEITKKEIKDIVDSDIESLVLDIIKSNKGREIFNTETIAEVFINFYNKERNIKANLFEINDKNKKEKELREQLTEVFGYHEAPWDLINKLFEDNNFKYRLIKPTDNFSYTPKFSYKETSIDFNQLSSGEQVIVKLILWVYSASSNSEKKPDLLLLDEFDAHLNPAFSQTFIKIIKDVVIDKFKIKVIMTTHSPVTVSYCDDENIFWMENGKIEQKDKLSIVEELTPNILTIRNNFLFHLIDKDYVVLTEGETDIIYIKEAIERLGNDTNKFKDILDKVAFVPCNGAKNLKLMLNFVCDKDNKFSKIIGIFDFDDHGINQYNSFGLNKVDSENISKKLKDIIFFEKEEEKIVGILVPAIDEYREQAEYGYFPIELLFKKKDIENFLGDGNSVLIKSNKKDHYFRESVENYQELNLNQDSKKKFADYVKENAKNIDFSNFTPLLKKLNEFILDKK